MADENANMRPLNDRQRRFVELLVSGMAAGRAYEAAGYDAKGRQADAAASRLLTNASIKAEVKSMRGEAKRSAKISRDEAIEMLTDILMSKPNQASMKNPLCELKMSKAGPYAAFPDKSRAMERLAKMLGWDEPEKHKLEVEVTIGGNAESQDQD